MPQRRTAKKELRKNITRHARNIITAQKTKTAIKRLKKSIEDKNLNAAQEALKEVYKNLDRAASKRVIHPNKASRKKSRLSKLLKKAKVQTS